MKRHVRSLVLALFVLACTASAIVAAPWKFLIYGDTRTQDSVHVALVSKMVPEKAELVFNTGDMVARGLDPDQWARFFEIIEPLRQVSIYYPVRGNHDYGTNYLDNYEMSREGLGHFDVPTPRPGVYYYAVQHENVKFIVLDPFVRTDPKSLQGEWLRRELEASKKVPFVFALFHFPIFNVHPRRPDNERLREDLHPAFQKYSVSAIFNGHDHYYYRTKMDGLTYVISGGGGAPLYDIDQSRLRKGDVSAKAHHYIRCEVGDKKIRARVIGLDGKILDEFEIKAR